VNTVEFQVTNNIDSMIDISLVYFVHANTEFDVE
jgi:hypothetical protein